MDVTTSKTVTNVSVVLKIAQHVMDIAVVSNLLNKVQ